ncbi:MAG: flagellar basal body rod protein FlgC [Alicyclobacillaceae bacterium]|nr:flagellar basal body rod protein FlgC [Alicyclobacillaceae bacterium]
MGWQDFFAISGSGLTAERLRMDVIANNIANANTTRRTDGTPGPYRRRMVVMEPEPATGSFYDTLAPLVAGSDRPAGVRVSAIVEDPSPFQLKYDPGNPDAVQDPASPLYGYVQLPNVDIVTEMVDLISASRAYEANVTALEAGKMMAVKALEIGRG